MKRVAPPRTVIVVGISLAVLLTGGAVVASTTFKTTEQEAAAAEPPEPSIITAEITKGQLADSIPLNCETRYRQKIVLTDIGETPRVQTRQTVNLGDGISDGTVLAEINGEPIFGIIGAFPLYRDLDVGDYGPDAKIVNTALVRMGLMYEQSEEQLALISEGTRQAIVSLYSNAGYAPPVSRSVDVVKKNETNGSETGTVGPSDSPKESLIPRSTFRVLSSSGTVLEQPVGTGEIGDTPLLAIGLGEQGLACTTAGGGFPAEAQPGQALRVARLADKTFPISVLSELSSGSEEVPTGEVPTGQQEAEDSTTTPVDGRFVFVEIGDAYKELTGPVAGSLVVEQSNPDQFIVPSAALWTKGGRTTITVVDADSRTDIQVEVTFTAGGENTVVASKHTLSVGDQVLVSGLNS